MKLTRVCTLIAVCVWLAGVACAASEGAEEHAPPLLTFDPGVALWTILVFIALMIILRTAAWKPLLAALKQRETFIQVSIDDAKRQRSEAERLLAEHRAQLDQARDEATAIIDEGRRDAEAVRRRIHDEARQEADAQLARARREIELARDAAVKQLFDQTADLSVQVAARVLSKELTADDQRRLVANSLHELAAVDKTKLNETAERCPGMAQTFEQALEVAEVYAAALFALAEEAGQVDETGAELAELVRLEQAQPGLAAILRSDAISDDQRQASLDRMFRGRLSDLVLNTLHVMNAHGRAGLLAALQRDYVIRAERAAGQVEVRVVSAVALEASQRAEIEGWAAKQSGRRPIVEYVVDPAILGGLIVQIGGYRFDHSVRRHLRTVRGQLLERSNRGLNVGIATDG